MFDEGKSPAKPQGDRKTWMAVLRSMVARCAKPTGSTVLKLTNCDRGPLNVCAIMGRTDALAMKASEGLDVEELAISLFTVIMSSGNVPQISKVVKLGPRWSVVDCLIDMARQFPESYRIAVSTCCCVT